MVLTHSHHQHVGGDDDDDVNKPRYTVSLYLGLVGAETIEATRLQQTLSSSSSPVSFSSKIMSRNSGHHSVSCLVHAFEDEKTSTAEVWSVLGEQAFKDGAVNSSGS